MKKTFFLSSLLFTSFVSAQIVNIPDQRFKGSLLSAGSYITAYDINGIRLNKIDLNENKEIEVNELDNIYKLEISGFTFSGGIENLIGIENFKNLTYLDISEQRSITSIDLTMNKNLKILNCEASYNITSLNVAGLTNLKQLSCTRNKLTYLNIQGCTNLQTMDCSSNDLTSLNVQGLSNLQSLNCKNNELTSLNLQGCTNLQTLDCSSNQLPSLNVQGLTNLQTMDCSSNDLTSLNVQGLTNLQTLSCAYNQLTSLNVQGFINLQIINCSYNRLTSLNVQGCTNLQTMNCSRNHLTSLNVQGLSNLQSLNCTGYEYYPYGSINYLNLKGLTNLTTLECNDNKLTTLDVSKNTALTHLNCSYNQLTSLDVSKNTALTSLDCYSNQLTSLNVQGLTNLKILDCSHNKLTSLNVQGLTKLFQLYCDDNRLSYLNLKTGRGMIAQRSSFEKNPDLKYICANEWELENIRKIILIYQQTAEINTYCSFEPTGNKNTITGKLTFDVNNNGCDANDALAKNIKVKINDGTNTGYSITNDTATYTFYTQQGDFKVTPIFENPYYTVSPTTVNFADVNNKVKIQDFCIKPAKQIKDLMVSLVPIDRARPGFDAKYKLIYKNKGTTTQNASVSFTYDKNYTTFVSSTVAATSSTADTKTWSISNLKPFEEKSIEITLKLNKPDHPTYKLEGGETLVFKGLITPTGDETPLDNEFSLQQEVVNSFDPNDKTCLQGNSITPNMIGNYVDYQIRFENNGTTEATFIVVKDVIDTTLFDIESLVPVASSHPYHLTIKNGNVVEFYFENINLPFAPKDSNDPKAQGFVSFKIKTKSTLKVGDVLKNKADIYFDYNKPILTNEEQTKIENLSSEEIINNSKFIINYTNPAKDVIKFSEEVKSVQIFDLNGRLVQSSIVNGKEVNVSNLQNGNYVIKISTENGTKTRKLIVKN